MSRNRASAAPHFPDALSILNSILWLLQPVRLWLSAPCTKWPRDFPLLHPCKSHSLQLTPCLSSSALISFCLSYFALPCLQIIVIVVFLIFCPDSIIAMLKFIWLLPRIFKNLKHYRYYCWNFLCMFLFSFR